MKRASEIKHGDNLEMRRANGKVVHCRVDAVKKSADGKHVTIYFQWNGYAEHIRIAANKEVNVS